MPTDGSADVKSAIPRLIAEFVVIVVGVLVALGFDSYLSWRNDRELEREYLERLLDDVRYDLQEIDAVEGTAISGAAYLDTLGRADLRETFTPDRLGAALFIASAVRAPDLSQSTLDELVSAGRIGLIRSREVRTQLASYSRTFNEMIGFWTGTNRDFSTWVHQRVPSWLEQRFFDACGEFALGGQMTACPFDADEWSPNEVRTDLASDEARRLMTYQGWIHAGGTSISARLRSAAKELEAVLEDAIGGEPSTGGR